MPNKMQEAMDLALDAAVKVLKYQSDKPVEESALELVGLELRAADVILRLVAAVGAPATVVCPHDDRLDLSTLGGGPTTEQCRRCGARFVDGVQQE